MFFQHPHTLIPSGVVCVLAFLVWLSAVRNEDPFLSSFLLGSLPCLVYASAITLSMTSDPEVPFLNLRTLVTAIIFIAGTTTVIKQANKVTTIDFEYVKFSFPSKKLGLKIGQRTGRFDPHQAALKLQIFVKEGLQFRRLAKTGRLLGVCCVEGFLVFLALGAQGSLALLLFLATGLSLAAAIASIASRATLHPGADSEISITPPGLPQKPPSALSPSATGGVDPEGPFSPNEGERSPEFVPNPFENP